MKIIPIFGLVLAATVSCSQPADTTIPEKIPRPVLWTAITNSVSVPKSFAGTIAAEKQFSLGFRVSGRLASRDIGIGDLVKKGDLLATIDAIPYEQSARSAVAELANTRSLLHNASSEEARFAELVKTDTVSKAEFENLISAREAAQAQVNLAEANLIRAREQLDDTRLMANISGIITNVELEIGDIASSGKTIVTLADPLLHEAMVDVPEAIVSNLVVGDSATIIYELTPLESISGKIRRISPVANKISRTYQITVSLDEHSDKFRIGSAVNVEFPQEKNHSILLPRSALKFHDDATQIWILDRGTLKVHAMTIDTSPASNDLVSINSLLEFESIVVVAGVNSLEEGQLVSLGQEMNFE